MNNSNIAICCKDFGSFDLVVVGGGCTGVFAAIRAARLGLNVAIIEKSNCFGGVATNGLVNVWHTLFDAEVNEQIIAGLTHEVEQELLKGGNARFYDQSMNLRFDPNTLKCILDKMVCDNKIKIYFHTFYNSLILDGNKIDKIVVCNKDGMGTISAKFFIDSTGDGDLCRDVGLESYISEALQPPSPCCFLNGNIKNRELAGLINKYGSEFGLDDDWGWSGEIPGVEGIFFRADFHIFDKMCNKAKDLTEAEIEGRRKIYALENLLKKYYNPKISVVALSSQIGVRETVHFKTRFKSNEWDLLTGKGYDNTVMRGTYRVDIHHQNDNGITFKYLNGETVTMYGKSNKTIRGNWKEENGITTPNAPYYQIPFEILVQDKISNLIPVGRMINADEGAFGALRVMVNLNQLGEAAGVAAYLSVQNNVSVQKVCGGKVRETLCAGGSLLA